MSVDLELLHVVALLCVVALVFMVVLTSVVAGLGALVWANAIAAAHRARAHGLQVNTAEITQAEAEAAIESTRPPRADYVPPTEEEMREFIVASRADRTQEYTTTANDGGKDEPPIPPGGFYAEGHA